jgi:MFS family permease
MIIVASFAAIFVLAGWIPAHSNGAIITFSVLYGFISGGFVGLLPALVAQLSPTAEIGVRMAINSIAVGVAVLLGNPMGGAMISAAGGGYVGFQAFAGGTMAVGAVIFVFARLDQSRRILDKF